MEIATSTFYLLGCDDFQNLQVSLVRTVAPQGTPTSFFLRVKVK